MISIILPILSLFIDTETTTPSWYYPVLVAVAASFLTNLGVLLKYFLGKPKEQAQTRQINVSTFGQIQDEMDKLLDKYSHLASKITDVEWDSDRRYRKLRTAVLDYDDVFGRIVPSLDVKRDVTLIALMNNIQKKHREAFDEELETERKREEFDRMREHPRPNE